MAIKKSVFYGFLITIRNVNVPTFAKASAGKPSGFNDGVQHVPFNLGSGTAYGTLPIN